MEKQNELTKASLKTSLKSKTDYVAPETQVYCIQSEGVLCSSVNQGSVKDPEYGGSAGFGNSDALSIW